MSQKISKVTDVSFSVLMEKLEEVAESLKEVQLKMQLAADVKTGCEDRLLLLKHLRVKYLTTLSKKYHIEPSYVLGAVKLNEYELVKGNENKIVQARKEYNLAVEHYNQVKGELDLLNYTSRNIAREMLKHDLL